MILLSFDPNFDEGIEDEEEEEDGTTTTTTVKEFTKQFNKILQNYLSYFYYNNSNINNLIHKLPPGEGINGDDMMMINLKKSYFKWCQFKTSIFQYCTIC